MKLKTVLIGSFRREQERLREVYDQLNARYEVLCPKSIEFVEPDVDFVRAEFEKNDSVEQIEGRVLDSMRAADFVWLFAPNGYVGISASFEVGYAHALGIPIYATELPSDSMLSQMITMVVTSPSYVPDTIYRPGYGINGLQDYYSKVSKIRGWDGESAKDTMLLLVEEVGELARAIRKSEHLRRDTNYKNVSLDDELADVQLYLVHLANCLDINLAEAVTEKEIKNSRKFKTRQEK
jgi:NTP pyrophosphatase (non-canonical NTP hydrolase)